MVLPVCVYIYIYVCVCVFVCLCVYIYIYMDIYVHPETHACMHDCWQILVTGLACLRDLLSPIRASGTDAKSP